MIAGQFSLNAYPHLLLLKNDQQLLRYKKSGLTINNYSHNYPAEAINIKNLNKHIKTIIICVKAYDTIKILDDLKNNIDKNSIIILIHNGMGIYEIIQSRFPKLRIISCVSYLSAHINPQFNVDYYLGGKLYLGPMFGIFTNQEIEHIKKIFHNAKIDIEWRDPIMPALWKKFAINCCLNILTAYYMCKTGDLLNHLADLEKISAEVSQVLNAYNINISKDYLLNNTLNLINKISDGYSSTYQDIKNSKQTELSYLNIYLIKLAQEKNINLEFNSYLIRELRNRNVII
jgi:2-dehydropantoate 2-reductase